jgi:hypothetical protein
MKKTLKTGKTAANNLEKYTWIWIKCAIRMNWGTFFELTSLMQHLPNIGFLRYFKNVSL